MVRNIIGWIIAFLSAAIGAVILAAHFFSAPARFIVKNLDSEPVKVIAYWRDKTKNIGQLSPNTTTEFFVDEEAAMTFEITRSNGTAAILRDIDFTSDTSTRVEITHTQVEVKTDTQ